MPFIVTRTDVDPILIDDEEVERIRTYLAVVRNDKAQWFAEFLTEELYFRAKHPNATDASSPERTLARLGEAADSFAADVEEAKELMEAHPELFVVEPEPATPPLDASNPVIRRERLKMIAAVTAQQLAAAFGLPTPKPDSKVVDAMMSAFQNAAKKHLDPALAVAR